VIWIAVVGNFKLCYGMSKKSFGEWTSFVGNERNEVIERAKNAAYAWRKAGPYVIYLGTLTEQQTPMGWEPVSPLPELPKLEPKVPAPSEVLTDDDIPF